MCAGTTFTVTSSSWSAPTASTLGGACYPSACPCDGITHIVIDPTVVAIVPNSFNDCVDVTSIDFENARELTEIGDNAFAGLANPLFTSIDMSGARKLLRIGSGAFNESTHLAKIVLPFELVADGAASDYGLGNEAFRRTAIKTPDQVTWNGVSCFHSSEKVGLNMFAFDFKYQKCPFVYYETTPCYYTLVSGKSSCCDVQAHGFIHDYFELVIDSSARKVAEQAFRGCHEIEIVYFTQATQLQEIGNFAFYWGVSVAQIDLGGAKSLAVIGDHAFSEMHDLTNVRLVGSLTHIGFRAFGGTMDAPTVMWNGADCSVVDPAAAAFTHMMDCPNQACGRFNPIDTCVLNASTLLMPPLCSATFPASPICCVHILTTTITISKTLVFVPSNMFGPNCNQINQIVFHPGIMLERIGAGAFADTSVTMIDLGANAALKEIGEDAFRNAALLRLLKLPPNLESVGFGAFAGTALQHESSVSMNGVDCRNVTAENALKEIGEPFNFSCPTPVATYDFDFDLSLPDLDLSLKTVINRGTAGLQPGGKPPPSGGVTVAVIPDGATRSQTGVTGLNESSFIGLVGKPISLQGDGPLSIMFIVKAYNTGEDLSAGIQPLLHCAGSDNLLLSAGLTRMQAKGQETEFYFTMKHKYRHTQYDSQTISVPMMSNRTDSTVAGNVGVRHHIVATRDYFGGAIYVDGVEVIRQEVDLNVREIFGGAVYLPVMGAIETCALGGYGYSDGIINGGGGGVIKDHGFDGEISRFRIFNGALDAKAVAELYVADMPILEHDWNFIGAESDVVVDSVGGVAAMLVNRTVRGEWAVELNGQGAFIDLNMKEHSRMFGGAFTIEMVLSVSSINDLLMGPMFFAGSALWSSGSTATVALFHFVHPITPHDDLTLYVGRSKDGSDGSEELIMSADFDAVFPLQRRLHVIATVQLNALSLFINGSLVAKRTDIMEPFIAMVPSIREHTFVGMIPAINTEHEDYKRQFLHGDVSLVRLYSGAMTASQVSAAYGSTHALFPTLTTAPTSAPTLAPTVAIGSFVTFDPSSSGNTLIEYDTAPRTLIRANVASLGNLALNEVILLSCVSDDVILTPPTLAITAASTNIETNAISGFAIADRLQLRTRPGVVECELAAPGRISETITIPVSIGGGAQPSYMAMCTLYGDDDPTSTELTRCATTLTTNGNATVVLVGGDCDECPQPPFSSETMVSIGGVVARSQLVAGTGNQRLIISVPSIPELLMSVQGEYASITDFEFKYYAFNITTPQGTQGVVGRSIEVGGNAPRAGQQLKCAAHGFCPDVQPRASGIFFTTICEYPFLDPTIDILWNATATAHLFAYGTPPNCRHCPIGCRCPGGDRCRTEPGYYLEGETLPNDGNSAPVPCHRDPLYALERCAGWSLVLDRTECRPGYRGPICSECDEGYFPAAGGLCATCPTDRIAMQFVIAVSITFATIAIVAVMLVFVVQKAFGRDFKSGAGRAISFAAWVVSALRTQAQIGRTASSGQPALISDWYRFLKTFEANPSGMRPSQCSSSMAMYPIIVMALSVTATLTFLVLGFPCVSGSLIKFVRLMMRCGQGIARRVKEAMSAAKRSTKHHELEAGDDDDAAAVLGGIRRVPKTSRLSTGVNPMQRFDAPKKSAVVELVPMGTLKEQRRSSVVERTRVSAKSALIAFRLESQEAAAAKLPNESSRGLCSRKKKTKAPKEIDPDAPPKMKTDWAATGVGLLRKSIAGLVLGLHPIVANKAFRSIYCVRQPPGVSGGDGTYMYDVANAPYVLATELSRECFGPDHLGVFVLACITIGVSIVGFPLFVMMQLCRSGGMCGSVVEDGGDPLPPSPPPPPPPIPEAPPLSSLQERDPSIKGKKTKEDAPSAGRNEAEDDEGWVEHKPGWVGPVHAGLCCRCVHLIAFLQRRRDAFVRTHDSKHEPERFQTWSSFTHSDYKPEFFFIRPLAFGAITCIALANTFLNPDLLVAAHASVSLLGTQVARFAIIVLAIVIPMCLLLVCAPQKNGYRWKLPLKTFIDVVSLGMLALNAFSWSVRGETLTSPMVSPPWRATFLFSNSSGATASSGDLMATTSSELSGFVCTVNDLLAYAVLGASWLLLLTFAVFFIIFVVFRGAKLQKRDEEAQELLDAENALVFTIQSHLDSCQSQRALLSWRKLAEEHAGSTRHIDLGGRGPSAQQAKDFLAKGRPSARTSMFGRLRSMMLSSGSQRMSMSTIGIDVGESYSDFDDTDVEGRDDGRDDANHSGLVKTRTMLQLIFDPIREALKGDSMKVRVVCVPTCFCVFSLFLHVSDQSLSFSFQI